jgi:hypothetical protein
MRLLKYSNIQKEKKFRFIVHLRHRRYGCNFHCVPENRPNLAANSSVLKPLVLELFGSNEIPVLRFLSAIGKSSSRDPADMEGIL